MDKSFLQPYKSNLLESEMATNASFLAWKIPWRKEPAWLNSMGFERVGHC